MSSNLSEPSMLNYDPNFEVPEVSVMPMKLSDGSTDYFVHIKVGDREITPHVYKIKGRAEYDVDTWKYIFFGSEKPDLWKYNTESNE